MDVSLGFTLFGSVWDGEVRINWQRMVLHVELAKSLKRLMNLRKFHTASKMVYKEQQYLLSFVILMTHNRDHSLTFRFRVK